MKKSLFLLVSLLSFTSTLLSASVKVDGLYYDLNSSSKTAEVTYLYHDSSNASYVSGSVTIPSTITYSGVMYSVTSIGYDAFYRCSGLTSITIPNSVTSIGNSAFKGCSGLKTVYNCSNLSFSKGSSNYGYVAYYADKVINMPNGEFVDDFGFYTKDGVSHLCAYKGSDTQLVLPNNYKENNYVIDDGVFFGCSGLTSITIPNSVTSIGYYAFAYCSGLTKIVSMSTEPPLCSQSAFLGIDMSKCTLQVPTGCVDAYKAADEWKDFYLIETFTPSNIGKVLGNNEDDKIVDVYSLDGKLLRAKMDATRVAAEFSGKTIILRTKSGKTRKVAVK